MAYRAHSFFFSVLYLAVLAFTTGSCASVLNSRKERVDLYTSTPAMAIVGQDTFNYEKQRIRLVVPRSAKPLEVKLVTADQINDFEIFSRNSFAYWFNLYANYGIGMLIDYRSPKRYSYPGKVFLNPLDPSGRYLSWRPPVRNQEFALRLFIPYINSFRLQPDHEPDIKFGGGFWGLGFGLDYYHQPDQFLSLSLSTQINFFVPVPAAVDVVEEYESIRSDDISWTNNHRLGRLTLGYGLSYSNNVWMFQPAFIAPSRPPVKRSSTSVGLAFPMHYYTGNHFYFKLIYRPSFWRFSNFRPLAYEHIVSFGFGWDIRFRSLRTNMYR